MDKARRLREKREVPVVGARPKKNRKLSHSIESTKRQKRNFEGDADICLINLSLLYFNHRKEVDCEIHPPLGVLYLVSVLENNGLTVDFIDHQLMAVKHPDRDLFNIDDSLWFYGEMPDVIGLSCMANLLPFTILIAEHIKRANPNKTIILGGVGPFGVEEKILTEFPAIDVICRGEGEATLLDLVKHLESGRSLNSILGISYRDNNCLVHRNLDRPRLTLSAIPFPAYHRMEFEYYDAQNLITNRGCPYRCSFCSVSPVWNHQTTSRRITDIIKEIRFLKEKYDVSRVLFQDEFFYVSEKQMLAFCAALKDADLKIEWKCFGRINLVTEKALQSMRDVGCIEIRYGVESASDHILSRVVKKFTFKEVLPVVEISQKYFPTVETFFIWGFPFEDVNDFMQTAIQMERLRRKGVNVLPSLLSFLPQTEIYHDYLKGKYSGKLTFHSNIIPIFVATGHESLNGKNNIISDQNAPIYNMIDSHPEIFPGFYLYNYESNVLPKYDILSEMGFV